MGDFVDIATKILSQSTDRIETSAKNVANIGTAGYKRRVSFASLATGLQSGTNAGPRLDEAADFTAGKLVETGNPADLAIAGDGFFAVRAGGEILYTRQGQFHRDADGRLVSGVGHVLQAEGGGDLITPANDYKVTSDGVVLADGAPLGKVAVVAIAEPKSLVVGGGGDFRAADGQTSTMTRPSIRQGAIEASNVSTADEMMSVMEALRRAEAGQRLINLYDDLMGRALTSFGQQ